MNVSEDMSLLSLITNASVLVQLVMVLLLGMSLVSWWFIFRKTFVIRDALRRADEFERSFWSGADLGTLYQAAVSSRNDAGSLERIFESGFREFVKLRKQPGISLPVLMDGTRRAMRAMLARTRDSSSRAVGRVMPRARRMSLVALNMEAV